MKYKKINKEMLLYQLCYNDIGILGIGEEYQSVKRLAKQLETSLYQIRKYLRQLKQDGVVEYKHACFWHKESYEYDEYEYYRLFGWVVNDKKVINTNIYKKALSKYDKDYQSMIKEFNDEFYKSREDDNENNGM